MADDTVEAARERLRERVIDRKIASTRTVDELIDALIAAVRAEGKPDPTLTPGCDCDQSGNPDAGYHASDCNWRVAVN